MPHVSSDRAGSLQLLGGMLLAVFLGALEQTIIAAALPSIARDLHRFDLLAWTVAAYLLATAVSTPIIGKLSDLYGRRLAMRLCACCFMLGSLLCAVAVSMPMLIAARMLQGVGGAGLIIVGQATVADMAGPRERGRYAGYFAIVWAVAGLIGPLLGGLLTEEVSWRAIFWINLPLSIVVLLLSGRGQVEVPRGRLASGIDYAGTAVFIVSITVFMLALSWGGGTYAWLSWQLLGCFGLAVLMMLLFGWRQRSAAEPMIPLRFLVDTTIGPALAVSFLMYGFYIAIAVLMPTYFQIGLGLPASYSGLLLIPMIIASATTAFLGGRYVARTGMYRLPVLLGFPVAIAALLTMSLWATQLQPLSATALLVAVGLGIGPASAIINVVAQNAATPEQMGTVTGAMAFFRTLGGAIITTGGSALILPHLRRGTESVSVFHLGSLSAHSLSAETLRGFRGAFGELFLAAAIGIGIATLLFISIRTRSAPAPDAARGAQQPAAGI